MKPIRLWTICIVVLLIYFGCVYYYLKEDAPASTNPLENRRTVMMPPEVFNPITDCVTPFGTHLGTANHTPAYSNCASVFLGKQVSYFSFEDPMDTSEPKDYSKMDKVMTATRWSAMDFVMRWMALNRGLMPMLLDDTNTMWNKDYFYNPAKVNQEWNGDFIINYHDADSPEQIAYTRPRPGDLIMYTPDYKAGFERGHIAVIVAVKNDIEGAGGVERYKALAKRGTVPRILYIAEQNFDNKKWAGEWYSRVAYFKWKEPTVEGMHPEGYIEDDTGLSILGRMRVGKPRVPEMEGDKYAQRIGDDDDAEDL